ncbi:hypothetical protein CRUP_023927 [Coryphaenoides rupestris]|nr:hypothetical protein CRUP_023927 [Coryphaenoides rupestris]
MEKKHSQHQPLISVVVLQLGSSCKLLQSLPLRLNLRLQLCLQFLQVERPDARCGRGVSDLMMKTRRRDRTAGPDRTRLDRTGGFNPDPHWAGPDLTGPPERATGPDRSGPDLQIAGFLQTFWLNNRSHNGQGI